MMAVVGREACSITAVISTTAAAVMDVYAGCTSRK